MKRISVFLVVVALAAGTAGCGGGVQYSLHISTTVGGDVTTPGVGDSTYDEGTVVNLVAQAEEGYYFLRWTGDVGTIGNTNAVETTITMNHDYSITANFEELDPGTLFAGGNGTAENPYQIANWHHLYNIRDYMNNHFILINDLKSTTAGYWGLAGSTANGGCGWQPIGDLNERFNGSFDGQGYEIRGLFIHGTNEVGLFGFVDEGGYIRDIGVINTNVTGGIFVGILVGDNFGHVSNAYSTGSVTGTDAVGGLLGFNDGPINASHFIGNVTGNGAVGGLVGANWLCSVSDCYVTGSVTGDAVVGGLVGSNEGTVSNSCFLGTVTGDSNVGGLMGENIDGTVDNSCSSGSVIGTYGVGGLNGLNTGTINNSYSTGMVYGETYVGGLVGDNTGAMNNSYSTGSVTGIEMVGGLVGRNRFDGVASNSFWDVETSGQATSDGGTGKNTPEMQDFITFSGVGWNITTVASPSERNTSYSWNMVDDETYPFLSWEAAS